MQCHRRIQRSLTTQGWQDRVGPFLGDYRLNDGGRDGFDIGRIREIGIGHDGGGIRVDEDHADSLFSEHTAGLSSRIVELCGLANHNRAGPNHQYRRNVVALWHLSAPS